MFNVVYIIKWDTLHQLSTFDKRSLLSNNPDASPDKIHLRLVQASR